MKKEKKPFALIIFGPTAVGKTDFALELAKHLPAEIINGDSAQFYTPFSVGTAKPDWKHEVVPHHLFDIIDKPRHFTVFEYRTMLLNVVKDVSKRGKLPIIVGGSGFYLKSIFFPPKAQVKNNSLSFSQDENMLWESLNQIDPVRASQIHPQDIYRIKRALTIWQQTGVKPSEVFPEYSPPINFMLVYLSRDQEELYERINNRTEQMIKQEGWLKEAESLIGTEWEEFLYQKKFIGYDDLFEYLHKKKEEQTLDDVIALIQQKTRNYAKRQKTFWKGLKKQLDQAFIAKGHEKAKNEAFLINLTLLSRDLYIKQLIEKLRVHNT